MAWTSPRTWVTGETPTAGIFNTHVRDNLDAIIPTDAVTVAAWSPTLQGTTSNDTAATVSGARWRVGPIQHVWARWEMGGDGTQPIGTFFVTLPVTATSIGAASGTGTAVGSWRAVDLSASANSESGAVFLATTTTARFGRPIGTVVTDAAPFDWTVSDVLSFFASYPVA